jgi:N-acetyl-gamma-glutamyl-phosphate reductase
MTKGIGKQEILKIYQDYYSEEPLIQVKECEKSFIYSNEKANKDDVTIYVYGSQEHPVVSAVFDNLGKGASGAAVQCMNLMLGIQETSGLFID